MINSMYKALCIAREAHKGQVDKSGKDYINHPIKVSAFTHELCVHNNKSEEFTIKAMIVALLHDVVEDTDTTLEDLKPYFSEDVITALSYMTHKKETPYMNYVRNIVNNEIATYVKLSDLRHNMDLSRLDVITDKDRDRVENKYKPAYKLLVNHSGIKVF